MMNYIRYWGAMVRYAIIGPGAYVGFLCALAVPIVLGIAFYSQQLTYGLAVTNLSDQVSWGAYIANFTFLVGVAAAAVLLVIPSYVYHHNDIKQVVLLGELMAVSAIVMCLCFVMVDIGRPDRVLHMMPGLGRLHLPQSILAWDVVVLSGYLLLNLHVPGYLLYRRYRGETPNRAYYLPFVLVSIVWAVSIHTVTAFLYSGFASRPYWNSAILAPRFLVSAFASGPALLLIMLWVVRRSGAMMVPQTVFAYLVRVIRFALPLNMFLLACELFKEFYTNSAHSISAVYLYFGAHGHALLVPYIWTGLSMGVLSLVLFLLPNAAERGWRMLVASGLAVVGVWIEKGMGLVVPGFVPSPTGEWVEYTPSLAEFFICAGIWALGTALFTVMARVALAITEGRLRVDPG